MEADRTEIEMIFNNLISNAVKYNRDHGRVTVSASVSGGEITIQVQDTGIGMTQEECKRLFVDFSRIKNEKTRHILGSGLGLSTLKKLVTLYNGEITARSQPEVGSTFVVVLCRNPEASRQNTRAESLTGSII
jgi:signal transduction histidine kinase